MKGLSWTRNVRPGFGVLAAVLAIFVAHGGYSADISGKITFENMAGAKLDYTQYEMYVPVPASSFSGVSFGSYWPNANRFYWATANLPLPNITGGVSTIHYKETTDAPVTLTFSGGSDSYFGPEWYMTYGFGVSSMFIDSTTSAEYQAINPSAPSLTLSHLPAVFASSSADNKTFLFAYDNSEWTDETYSTPTLFFSDAIDLKSIDFANTAYTFKTLQEGSTYGATPYPAKFGINIYGLDADGNKIAGATAQVVLSEGRNVVDDWLTFDFETEAAGLFEDINGLRFEMFSTDINGFGIATPLYFALDNIVFGTSGLDPTEPGVPEPATWVMLLMAAAWLGWRKLQNA